MEVNTTQKAVSPTQTEVKKPDDKKYAQKIDQLLSSNASKQIPNPTENKKEDVKDKVTIKGDKPIDPLESQLEAYKESVKKKIQSGAYVPRKEPTKEEKELEIATRMAGSMFKLPNRSTTPTTQSLQEPEIPLNTPEISRELIKTPQL